MRRNLVLPGPRLYIWKLVRGDRCPVEEFFSEGLQPKDRERLVALIRHAALTWPAPLSNKQKCKRLKGYPGLCEFKDKSGARLLFFLDDDNNAVLTHGFRKTTDETPDREIQRALKMQHEWVDGGRQTDE